MRLRSFSLSKIVPVEIINLIIQESSHSTLHAWTLVSFGCLSISGPLLNERVQIATQRDLNQILQRITLAEDDPAIQLLPRLSPYLSLKDVRRLTFLVEPNVILLENIFRLASSPQPKRKRLELDFAWKTSTEQEEVVFRSFIAPTLVNLLRPAALWDRISIELVNYQLRPIRSWALQCYYNILLILSPIPASEIPSLDPEGNLLGHFYGAILAFAISREGMKRLLRPRGLSPNKELELKKWIEKVERLDVEQAEKLKKRMDEGWKGSSVALTEANQISHDQLEEIGVFMDSLEDEDEE